MTMQSPKRQKVEEEEYKWSKLCRDVLKMVFERLNPADFDRSRAVCSAWRSVSIETVRKQNQIPWLVLFPYERSYRYCCGMLNPSEKGFVYRSRSLGVEFTQSRCLATCGSWLLMYVRHQPKLYILNPLTRERINLPPLESRKNDFIISPEEHPQFNRPSGVESVLAGEILDLSSEEKLVLWVDDNSKDYLVVWSYAFDCLFFSKKGDDFWRMFPYPTNGCRDFVYKAHKLYVYTWLGFIEIYDFSGNSPVVVETNLPYAYHFVSRDILKRIAVTPSGEVLIVRCYYYHFTPCNFYIYKMNHDTQKWDYMPSLGDHALIFDLGITVSTKDIQGIKADSIYFSGLDFGTNNIFIFNLATFKVERFMSSTNKFFDARWFIPSV